MSVPQIPPRPARAHQQHPTMAASDIPKIPPRPAQRRTSERSESPNRDHFPRSPFNEPPISMGLGNKSGSIYGSNSQNASTSNLDLPQRPPSVSLPSIGQEGNEYGGIEYEPAARNSEPEATGNEPQETRSIGSDLPLHAPRPSFSNSTAKARVSTVTRTDSSQAAAAGIGKAPPPSDDSYPHDRPLKPKVSFRTASSASTERPGTAQAEDEHGIPEIGQRVPMYPDAGDVQAPSPSPFQQTFPAGIGFHNSGSQKPSRHHRRTPSGREILPPGSYGMHGHGLASSDHFEKSWYEKHPEALEKEEGGQYGPGVSSGRGEWALSSDDLNKLVRETSKLTPDTPGLPKDEIGWKASEEYASRLNTPMSGTFHKPLHSNHSQPHVESPLRKASFPIDPDTNYGLEKQTSHTSSRFSSENALESETEDDEVQMPPSKARQTKVQGTGYNLSAEDLGLQGSGSEGERTHEVPILAADEVARTPGAEYMQPAVSPTPERRGSSHYSGYDSDHQSGYKLGSRSGSASNSRPTSRPGSVHGVSGLSRFHDEDRENMHTPLEDVDEYEPLFPDEEGNKERKPVTAADRIRLREQMKRFPSKDIWEDTPDSAQLQASVETPEPANEQPDPMLKAPTAAFETPEQEGARKGEVSEAEKAKLIPREERLAKSNFQPHIRNEMTRPGLAQRFPSRDIWEDSPDSSRLEATVGETPTNDQESSRDAGLEAGAVVNTSGAPSQGILSGEQPRDNATVGAAVAKPTIPPRPGKDKAPLEELGSQPPSVPARPPRRLHQVPPADAQVPIAPSKLSETSSSETQEVSPINTRPGPSLPDRPKPQVPARPAKPVGRESSETIPLAKITSASSVGSDGVNDRETTAPPGAPKPKPAVPARPAGGKIASLKAGFLSDLDSRLKLGPQGPKPQEKAEPEIEEDKAPLADARKGRARGPARRKPVAPAAEAATASAEPETKGAARNWQVQQPWTVWQHDGTLKVGHHSMPSASKAGTKTLEEPNSPQRSATTAQIDGSEDAKDMEQARTAVEESITATHPLSEGKLRTPEADLPSSTVDGANSSSYEPSNEPTAGSLSPATVISPTETHTHSQAEEKTVSTDPVTEIEGQTHTIPAEQV